MKLQYRDVMILSSSFLMMALSFQIALVVLEFRMFQEAIDEDEKQLNYRLIPSMSNNETNSYSTKTPSDRSAGRQRNSSLFISTIHDPSPTSSTDEFTHVISNAPPCIQLQPEQVTFTLVTQCGEERLPLIAQLCARWKSPLSVAVFTKRSAEDIVEELAALTCQRDQLTVRTLEPSELFAENSYPVNRLRNLAVDGVTTTHMVHVDVDFFPSDSLEQTIQSDITIRQVLADDYKHALVVPAFDFLPNCQRNKSCGSDNDLLSRMPRTKDYLMHLYAAKEATMFHDYWPPAHDTTNYATWMQQADASLIPIPCIKSNHYEPYLIVRKCSKLPPFQEAYKGYGHNKASFTMQLQAMGYRFSQVGGIFVTHFPHAVSKSKQLYDQNKHRKMGQRLQMERLVARFAQWLNETYGKMPPRTPYCSGA